MNPRKDCDTDALIKAYCSGVTIAELEKKFGMKAPSIYARLDEAGVERKTKKLHEDGVGCPCFRAAYYSTVKCEAGLSWNHLSLNFGAAEESKAYRARYCGTQKHTQCPLYMALMKEATS